MAHRSLTIPKRSFAPFCRLTYWSQVSYVTCGSRISILRAPVAMMAASIHCTWSALVLPLMVLHLEADALEVLEALVVLVLQPSLTSR